MKRLLGLLAILIFGSVAPVIPATAADAHTVSSHFTRGLWPDGTRIRFGFHTGFPGGEYRNRVFDGANAWNAAANTTAEPKFSYAFSDANRGSYSNPCGISGGSSSGAVFWMRLEDVGMGDAFGATNLCRTSTTILLFVLAVDSDTYWSTSAGAPGPAIHLRSVTTHEFGHATGFIEHFTESDESICPFETGRHTMCPSLSMGSYSMASLDPHDLHTEQAAY